jgi:hypothetical protein
VEVVPPGTTTLIEDAGWSWFEEERATFTPDGGQLLTSAVAGTSATAALPGTVLLTELDMATGARRVVDLGRGEPDDHNSASIHASVEGEVLTAWTRHHKDQSVRTQRRRTDGSWLRLPPVLDDDKVTYSNLRESADEAGLPILYDFLRGERFDPEVIASSDAGRTWASLGRVVRDDADSVDRRPYVQYSEARNGRIDLLVTPGHPDELRTGVYHGYVQGGKLHSSSGEVLGALGTAVPVSSLTPVWLPTGMDRGWTSDITTDPATGMPVATFSVRHSDSDHRYWWARWDGTEWEAEEIAFAGRALYETQPNYTGLVTLDPGDPARVVISTDVSPNTAAPLISSDDASRHWELWEGQRGPSGEWSWQPLTADSPVDNLRPVIAEHEGGAEALLWLRGTYASYLDYDLDVVAAVERADGSSVVAGAAQPIPATDVLEAPSPRSTLATPVVGAFDGHDADDLLMVRPGTAPDDLFLGDRQRHLTRIATRSIQSSSIPIAGDFDAKGRDDILWYAVGPGPESLWSTSGVGTFSATAAKRANGTFIPIVGDFDGNHHDDVFWYAPGVATDRLWAGSTRGFLDRTPPAVTSTVTPVAGDYDGDGFDDIFWYAPGAAIDRLWFGGPGFAFTGTTPRQVSGTYAPLGGDFDGDGHDDIFWYAPGSTTESMWLAEPDGSLTPAGTRQVRGTYRPIVSDLDGDGADDIQWYSGAVDPLWWSAGGPLAQSGVAPVDL